MVPRMKFWSWIRRHKAVVPLKLVLAVVPASLGVVTLEALFRAQLSESSSHAPTRFYARPLVIEPGMTLDRGAIEEHLTRLGYRRARSGRDVDIGEYYLGYSDWTIGRRVFRHDAWVDPGGTATLRVASGRRVTNLRDARGRSVRTIVLEPEPIGGRYGDHKEERAPVGLEEVPSHLVDAVLTVEDRRFFQHGGLDFKRILGAAAANLKSRRVVEGASTVTQQLAKNLFLSSRRSPVRKLREALMAVALEARYDKATILQAYLNEVYLGQDGALAIHGVESAARHYFAKDVSQLTLAESALLAGIIRGPSVYSPFRHPESAIERRNLVLDLMLQNAVISSEDKKAAERARLDLRQARDRTQDARYFVDFAARQLEERYGKDALGNGLAVFTTLDTRLQRAAEKAVQRGLDELEAYYPRLTRASTSLQAALVALDHRSGEILALVGGRDYGRSQFNRAVWARRQPGSSFKPIVALAALASSGQQHADLGGGFTLASVIEDAPLSIATTAGNWEPANYDDRFRGPVTLREALENSLNVPFARLGLEIGPERIAQAAKRLGIDSRLHVVPSLALGSSEVTPLEMTRAFGVFAANGYRAPVNTTIGVLDRTGVVLQRLELDGEQVYTPAEAYLITSALQGAVERGTGRGVRSMGFRGPLAAKSGTTNDFRDAWFIGYTPTLSVGVWVGFDDGTSIGLSGSRAAMPIFTRFLIEVTSRYGEDDFEIPSGLEVVEVNRESGLLGGPGCRGEEEVFLEGTSPATSCSPYWASSQRYGSRSYRWYERLLRPLIQDLRRSLRDRR